MPKPKMLITGGQGDLAKAVAAKYRQSYELSLPSSKELNVTEFNSVKSYVGNTKFDVLINNAGTIHPKRILESDEYLWERDIRVNLLGPYYVTKQVLESNPEALIINISSTAAFNAYKNWSSYCASKAALVTFTKCLASDGYSAYCLCPGAIATKFRKGLNLSSTNEMKIELFVEQILSVINASYKPGDVIYFTNREKKINP